MILYRLLDAFPNPWNARYLSVLTAATVLTTAVAALRAGAPGTVTALLALASAMLALFGRLRLNAASGAAAAGSAARPFRVQGYLLVGLGLLVAVAVLTAVWTSPLEWVAVLLPFALLVLCEPCFRATGFLPALAVPALLALAALDTAVLMGKPAAGGYPAAFAFLLGVVVMSTRRVELQLHRAPAQAADIPVHHSHRGAIAWLSTVFFFFGVSTLWPWLGKLYGMGYLWVLIVGVLAPTLFLWGRLKQPRSQPAMATLHRFNQLLPYVGLVLLVAILVG